MFVVVCLISVDSFVAEFVMGSLDLFQMRQLYSSFQSIFGSLEKKGTFDFQNIFGESFDEVVLT